MKILNKVTLATKLSFLMLCVAFSFAFIQEANEKKTTNQETEIIAGDEVEGSAERIAILDTNDQY